MKKLILLILCALVLESCLEDKETAAFRELEHPAMDNGQQPFLFSDGESLLMSWTEKENDTLSNLYYASYNGKEWSKATKLTTVRDMFVNWADFPAIIRNGNSMIAHYLQKSDTATFAYDVKYLHSPDGGKNWSDPEIMHEDSTKTEHGFVSFVPSAEGSFWSAWLDGRNTGGQGHGSNMAHEGPGAMQLRAAQIDTDGNKTAVYLVDEKTCDCCQTDMAMTDEGPILAYRDRSDGEIRDIYTTLYTEGNWTRPAAVAEDGWEINGCPVNGPALDAAGKNVAISWFTAANNSPEVKVAFSDNSGRNFGEPKRLDHGKAIGRVDLLILEEEMALVSWMESTEEEAKLLLALVSFEGKVLNEWTVGEISSSRSSGFPRMQRFGNALYIAWNERMEGDMGIKVVRMTLQDIIP